MGSQRCGPWPRVSVSHGGLLGNKFSGPEMHGSASPPGDSDPP